MIVKYTWEKEDIKAGRYVIRNSSPYGSDNISYAASCCSKIGWRADVSGDKKYVLISIEDGMVLKEHTKDELVDKFNREDNGYRPVTNKELLVMITFLETLNEGTWK